jgi:hypothetical protein
VRGSLDMGYRNFETFKAMHLKYMYILVMAFSGDEIRAIVNEIRTLNIPNKEHVLKAKHSNFFETYPRLFMAALNPNFPLEYLDMMLAQRDKMSSGEQTIEETDKAVYDVLRERYVKLPE